MLGTLAIMAIITVVGVKMFNSAMTQHRANELINEANKRAVSVAAQLMAGREKNALSIAEFTNPDGYTFGVEGNATNNNRFNITVGAVDVDVCKKMKSMIGPYTVLRALSSDCTTLTFNDDLSREAVAGDYDLNQSACTEAGHKWCRNGDNGTNNKCLDDSTDCCTHVEYDLQCQNCSTMGQVSNKANTTPCDFDGDGNNDSTCNSGVCPKPGITTSTPCTTNAQCGGVGSGWYCKINYTIDVNLNPSLNGKANSTEQQCFRDLVGTCAVVTGQVRLTKAQKEILTKAGFQSSFVSGPALNWWSASNWCEAQGKHLVDIAYMDCYYGPTCNTQIESGHTTGYCCKQGQTCQQRSWNTDQGDKALWKGTSILPGKAEEVAKFSAKLIALRKVYGEAYFWTSSPYGNTSQNSCYAFGISVRHGYVYNYYSRNGSTAFFCQ